MTIADLTEQFVQAKISFDDALQIVQERKIVYAPDATMQAMLSDRQGRTLIIEPGIGWREDDGCYCAGYACGYHLVKHYLKKTGKSIIEATLLPASEILETVEDFWNE